MVIALGGTLQRSHLHVANVLNVVVHTSASDKGAIDAAAAYSASPAQKNARIVIGDTLTLEINVAWYAGQSLITGKPGKVSGSGGGGGGGSLFSLLFGVFVGAGLCYLWVNGTEALPKSIKTFVVSRIPGKNVPVLPRYNGFGYSSNGTGSDGFSSVPKKD
jgi:hypothetical protein